LGDLHCYILLLYLFELAGYTESISSNTQGKEKWGGILGLRLGKFANRILGENK
jgi:hypothetical protein